jgi:GntR family transcriptional repressor for pyruvate dehydrogenase complex
VNLQLSLWSAKGRSKNTNISLGAKRVSRKTSQSLFETVQPPTRLRLSDSIINQIESLILEGALKPGNQLPPEREFAERLGVSRPSLREALLKLEARGLVTARRGGGYAVADVTAPTLTDPLVHLLQTHAPAAYDILELRLGLEAVAAYLAAQRATDADKKEISRRYAALLKAEKTGKDELKGADADLEFHMSVADASHNVALMHVMHGLMNLIRTSTLRFRQRIFSLHDDSKGILNDQHRGIYEAVMNGNAEAARDAVNLQLSFIEATIREIDRDGGTASPAPRPAKRARKSPNEE